MISVWRARTAGNPWALLFSRLPASATDEFAVGAKTNPDRCAPTLTDAMQLVELVQRYSDWALAVYCVGCMRTARRDPMELSAKYGPGLTIGRLKARLKCPRCANVAGLSVKPVLKRRRER